MKPVPSRAFSLVEITISLGIVAFAILTLLALLPIGLKSNQTSTDETRASYLATTVEADLRSGLTIVDPATGLLKSSIFKLTPPYKASGNAAVPYVFNDPVTAPAGNTSAVIAQVTSTTGVTGNEAQTTAQVGVRYQATVVYTKLPLAGSAVPLEARIIVSWPCLSAAQSTAANLVDHSKTSGFIERYVTFPAL